MSDLKSKLPDFKEFLGIANKLFCDIKTSVSEIATEYKKKHFDAEPAAEKKTHQAKAQTAEENKGTKKVQEEKNN